MGTKAFLSRLVYELSCLMLRITIDLAGSELLCLACWEAVLQAPKPLRDQREVDSATRVGG